MSDQRTDLDSLWSDLLTALKHIAISADPITADMLNVVRLFLKDNATKSAPDQGADMQTLHRALTSQLIKAMDADGPIPATLLETLRRFLADNNVTVDVSSTLELRAGLEQLTDLSLPFNH